MSRRCPFHTVRARGQCPSEAVHPREAVNGEGAAWHRPERIALQYRLADCIGVLKCDESEGLMPPQRGAGMSGATASLAWFVANT